MVETVVCVVVLGLMLTAAMRVASASSMSQLKASERVTGRLLADGLLAEILALSYADTSGTPVFGRETGESSGSKQNYSDVDDFHGWSETPPQDRSGAAIEGMPGWKRQVSVVWVQVPDVSSVSAVETGAKRVTVTVTKDGRPIATAVGIKTDHP